MEGNVEITKENIEKAFSILDNISKGGVAEPIVKSEEDKEREQKDKEEKDKVEKAQEMLTFCKGMYGEGKTKDECIEGMVRKGYTLTESQSTVESVISDANNEKNNGGTVTTEAAPIVKSEDIIKEVTDILSKSFKDTIGENLNPVNDLIQKGFGAVNDLIKSMGEENTLLKGELNKLTDRIGKIETTPVPSKSLRNVGVLDKFNKSEDGGEGVRKVNVLSKSEKANFVQEMYDEFEKSHSPEVSDAIMGLEIANHLSPAMQKRFGVQLIAAA